MAFCYYCNTQNAAICCHECGRWQCDSDVNGDCKCVCLLTDADLYSQFTGDMSPSDVLDIGLANLTAEIAGLWQDTSCMDGFDLKYRPDLGSDQERIKALAATIYEYARKG